MNSKKFLGYRMVLCCFMIAMAVLGMGYLTLNIYAPILLQEMQSSMSVISIMFSVLSGVSMVGSAVSGTVSEKIGLKKMIILGIVSLLTGYIIFYFAVNIMMLYIAAAFVGLSASWAGVICIGRVIPNWFVKKQGTFLGIVMAASGVGGMIASPVITMLITRMGWRSSLMVTLVAMAVLTIPFAMMLKEKPSDVGQVPLGYEETGGSKKGKKKAAAGMSFAQARSSSPFYLLLVLWIGIAFANGGFNSQVPNALTEKGFDLMFAGTVVALISLANTVGNLVLGFINDRFGIKAVLVFCSFCSVVSMVLMILMNNKLMGIAFALFFGICMTMSGTLITLIVSYTFKGDAFAQMLGLINSVKTFFSMLAPVFIGMMFDITNNYNVACFAILVLLVLGCIFGVAAISRGEMLQKAA